MSGPDIAKTALEGAADTMRREANRAAIGEGVVDMPDLLEEVASGISELNVEVTALLGTDDRVTALELRLRKIERMLSQLKWLGL